MALVQRSASSDQENTPENIPENIPEIEPPVYQSPPATADSSKDSDSEIPPTDTSLYLQGSGKNFVLPEVHNATGSGAPKEEFEEPPEPMKM